MFGNLGQAKKYLGQAAKMLIGIPDYDNYVTHMQTNHPDQPYMTYEEFFRERQQARYGATAKAAYAAVNGGNNGTDCSHPTHRFSRRRKTTLLRHILNEQHGFKIAVIENEFGEVSVDDQLIGDAPRRLKP